MSHPEFINLYNQWHAQLGNTFIGGLQSSEYMHTRITLVLLTRIVRHFPTKSKLGEKFGTVLELLHSDENPMQDIKLMALAYKSPLSTIQWKEEDTNVTKARDEKKREDRERKKINLQNMNKEIIDDVRNYDKRVKPASGPKRTLKFVSYRTEWETVQLRSTRSSSSNWCFISCFLFIDACVLCFIPFFTRVRHTLHP